MKTYDVTISYRRMGCKTNITEKATVQCQDTEDIKQATLAEINKNHPRKPVQSWEVWSIESVLREQSYA